MPGGNFAPVACAGQVAAHFETQIFAAEIKRDLAKIDFRHATRHFITAHGQVHEILRPSLATADTLRRR